MADINTEEQLMWMQEALDRLIDSMIDEGLIVADRAKDKSRPEGRLLRVPPPPSGPPRF